MRVAYRVPGLIPDRAVGGCCRHDLPGIVRPVRLEVAGGRSEVLEVVLAAAEREPGGTLIGAEDWAQLAPRIASGGAGVDLAAVIAARS